MLEPSESRWLTIYTKPHAEVLVSAGLEKRAYEALLPMCQVRYHDVAISPVRPLFPRYLFVNVHREMTWYPIMSVPGVSRLLCFGQENPSEVPAVVIDELVARLEADNGVVIIRSEPRRLTRGERCLVTAGPLSGFSGLFVDSTEFRTRLMMQFLGRSALTVVPSGAVVSIKAARRTAA